MNKPYLDQIQRRVLREKPNTYYAERLRFTLATARFKREIGRVIKKITTL